MSACEFAFDIGQRVRIVPINQPGTVLRRCDRGEGQHTYEVTWWADNDRHIDWLLASEIAP